MTPENRLVAEVRGLYGRGAVVQVVIGAPAAGADWTVRPPTGASWRLIAGSAKLVTSAAVATRIPVIQLYDGEKEIVGVPSSASQANGVTTTYELVPGTGVTTAAANRQIIPWPDMCIFDNRFLLQSATVALQAGDQWSAIALLFEEWRDYTPH